MSKVTFNELGINVTLIHAGEGDHISEQIIRHCAFYEEEMLFDIYGLDKPGAYVDVGANLGNHTVFFAKLMGRPVIAFEPFPMSFSILEKNVHENGLEGLVATKRMALSDWNGSGRIFSPDDENVGKARLTTEADAGEKCQISKLDDFTARETVGLIKIDVEGGEFDVIKGALETIKRDHPIIVFEAGSQVMEGRIRAYLSRIGYFYARSYNATPTHLLIHREDLNYAKQNNYIVPGVRWGVHREVRGLQQKQSELIGKTSKDIRKSIDAMVKEVGKSREDLNRHTRLLEGKQKHLEEALNRTEAEKQKLAAENERLVSEKEGLKNSYDELEKAQRQKAVEFSQKLNKAREDYRDRERVIKQSWSYRIGNMIVFAVKRPHIGIPMIPVKMLRVVFRKLKRMRARAPVVKSSVQYQLESKYGEKLAQSAKSGSVSIVLCLDRDIADADYKSLLDSAVNQETPPTEVLIVIPAKIPGIVQLLPSLLGKYKELKFISVPGDPCLADLVNIGLANAAGDWFNIINARTTKPLHAFHTSYLLACAHSKDADAVIGTESDSNELLDVLFRRASTWLDLGYLDAEQRCPMLEYRHRILRLRGRRVIRNGRANGEDGSKKWFRKLRASDGRGHDSSKELYSGFLPSSDFKTSLNNGLDQALFLDEHKKDLVRKQIVKAVRYSRHCILFSNEISDTHGHGAGDKKITVTVPEDPKYPFIYSEAPVPGLCLDRLEEAVSQRLIVSQRIAKTQPDTDRINVSVILPLHNGEEWIGRAMSSILRQTHKNLELIVVDDFSDDKSLDIARRFESLDSRVKVFANLENRGAYWSRNYGILEASGEVITFQDSDDWSPPTRIQQQLSELIVRDSVGVISKHKRVDEVGVPLVINGTTTRLGVMTAMYWKVKAFGELGFFDNVRVSADSEFMERVRARFGKQALPILNEDQYFALAQPQSLTSSGSTKIHFSRYPGKTEVGPLRKEYVESFRDWHKMESRDNLFVDFPRTKRMFSAPNELKGPSGLKEPSAISACVASIPSRERLLGNVVNAILPQVDRLFVYLNGYEEIPEYLFDERITVETSQRKGDLKDNGKFYFQDIIPRGYCFTIDDDIHYPPDYVRRMILNIEKYDRKAVVGLHGLWMWDEVKSFMDRRDVVHFAQTNPIDRFADILGTGVMAFHTDAMKPIISEFTTAGMADIWIAKLANKKNIPLICVRRRKGWVTPQEDQGPKIYTATLEDDSLQTQLVREEGVWTQERQISRAKEVAAKFQGVTRTRLLSAGVDFSVIDQATAVSPLKFELVCVGWNCERLARKCLKSIERQIFGNYHLRVIAVDDGSNDGTSTAIREFGGKLNVDLVQIPENKGPAYARHIGLNRVANPDAICVLVDLDDELLPGALKRLEAAYRESGDCWLTYGNWKDEQGQINPQEFYDRKTKRIGEYRRIEDFRATHLRSFRRFLYDAIGACDLQDAGRNWLRFCSDVALMYPLLEQCPENKITEIGEAIYLYRRHQPAGTIRRFGPDKKRKVLEEIKKRPARQQLNANYRKVLVSKGER